MTGQPRSTSDASTPQWLARFGGLVDAPAPAVLTTYRANGTAVSSPVWFRLRANVFEVVIAEGDVKLKHLQNDPRCELLIFEAAPPFRGLRIAGQPTLTRKDVTATRVAIASKYLGTQRGARFAAERTTAGVLLTLPAGDAHVWDLQAILPA